MNIISYRKIRVFLSSSWEDRDLIIKFREDIDNSHKGKYLITTRWWDYPEQDQLTYALEDMIGIKECDLFILYNGEKKTSGKTIELGMAIILGKVIRVYGNPLTTIYSSLIKYCGKDLPKNLNDKQRFDFFIID